MMITLLVFAFGPCGRLMSIDSLIRKRRSAGAQQAQIPLLDYKSIYAGWPIKLMQYFFPLMYLSAVTSKLSASGLDWPNGFTLQYYLIQDGIRWHSDLGVFISQFHLPIIGLQYLVILFQLTFFLILFFPKLKWIYLPMGLCFYIGIWITLHAPFPQWIFLYLLYIPWSNLFKSIYEHKITPTTSWLDGIPVA